MDVTCHMPTGLGASEMTARREAGVQKSPESTGLICWEQRRGQKTGGHCLETLRKLQSVPALPLPGSGVAHCLLRWQQNKGP